MGFISVWNGWITDIAGANFSKNEDWDQMCAPTKLCQWPEIDDMWMHECGPFRDRWLKSVGHNSMRTSYSWRMRNSSPHVSFFDLTVTSSRSLRVSIFSGKIFKSGIICWIVHDAAAAELSLCRSFHELSWPRDMLWSIDAAVEDIPGTSDFSVNCEEYE